MIRASFLYGNYDSLMEFPTFDLRLGAETWSQIRIRGESIVERKEVIHNLSSDYVHVCLVKTGSTTPFISALELRPLINTNYSTASGSLQTVHHRDCDSTSSDAETRYKDDPYGRVWTRYNMSHSRVSTSLDITNWANDNRVPQDVLRTASTPDNVNDPLQYSWETTNASDQFFMYMYIAEVEKLTNQFREFDIYVNEELWSNDPIAPHYRGVAPYFPDIPWTGSKKYIVTFNKTENSTLPPLLNAYEIFTVRKFSTSGTKETDVSAILNIKSKYRVIRDSWQGDPCEPEEFMWEGLECSNHGSDSARITTLQVNLSASGLTGEIVSSITNLTQLETLDLSNNNFSGQVPGFLSRLASLSVLNLKGNNFTGPIPAQLLENQKKGTLSLSFDAPRDDTNIELCGSEPCKKKSENSTPAIVGIVLGSVLFLAAILFGIWKMRRKLRVVKKLGNQPQVNYGVIERQNRQYTYSEVISITRNFQRVLGKGGFGTVYHGYVGDNQVAVKMLSPSSTQGYKEFQSEANLLMSVSHKNLTSMVGYCNEGTNMGIIYEYMANGSLHDHLSGRSNGILSWEVRLQIALDTAQGLEYLHHGCKPAIIHRDVKTSNVLLNEKFHAKLADFGLSRAYSDEDGTHITTAVAGTLGYLDPGYYTSNKQTEKGDVFSFGVVLLAIITGRPAISRSEDGTHIVQWVESIVQDGDVKQVVDSRLEGKFDVNCAWKAVELAMTCASRTSSTRPTMNAVVIELKECLALEFGSHDGVSNNSTGIASMDLESSLVPR
ncbi:hypothetical protein DCAR_0934076 [Daucus carota subsp. sativus]|uniref:non-specific serine/threonine protein kinase n=1 Tax=Daucus carota subsp. sativus TaxID=79200 RepID=A0AAF1BHE5_DAUCS|nr:hypothetical protein DCAR_0934076 [Daucus carota subsp. sativus]